MKTTFIDFPLVVVMTAAFLGGCAQAPIPADTYNEPVIVCVADDYQFSYVPSGIEAVHIYENGRHSIVVMGTDGVRRRIDSDDITLTCDAWEKPPEPECMR
jgi:hypothetical protein